MATEVEIGLDIVNAGQTPDLEELPELDGIGVCSPSRHSSSKEPEIVTEIESPGSKLSPELEEKSSPHKNDEIIIPSELPTSSTFNQEEAALNAFLSENKPKPKKLTIREMLENLPGFDKISQMRPTLGGGCGTRINPKTIIDLTAEKDRKPSKLDKAMDALLERFAKHATAGTNTEDLNSKPHHIKIHVNKLEKDSQGELHAVVDEIDYVTSPPDEETVDIIAQVNRAGSSPREQVPGEKMYRLKKALWTSIRARKAKEYEEKMKLLAMYNEEKELEDKAEGGDEILDDEIIEEDEITDSEEEEELEEEYDGGVVKEKKKRRRLLYVDDEAEDEDEERMSSSDDGDDNQELEDADNEDDDLGSEEVGREKNEKDIGNDDTSRSQSSQILGEKDKVESQEERSKSETLFVAPFSELMAKTGHEIARKELDMSNLCSGVFPSQPLCTPVESQYCFGFDEEDDEDENEELLDINENNAPSTSESKVEEVPAIQEIQVTDNSQPASQVEELSGIQEVEKINNETSKIEEAQTPSHRNQIDLNLDEEEEDLIHAAKKVKPKRLHFSDDEDEGEEDVTDAPGEISEPEDEIGEEEDEFDEDDEEAVYERQLVLQNTPQINKGLFGKDGRLKQKFFENEAELSGSDEGSEDEDETGVNDYENEEADEEDIDHDVVRNQLERAHLKHLLDKDDEEIRDLQFQYLERGDLEDGKARERKFKWTDIDGGWADDKAMMGDEEGEEEETAEDIKRKFDEIERRKWMLENSEVLEASEEESQKLLFENSRFLKLGKSTRKKIDSFIESSSSSSFNVINQNHVNQSCNSNGIQDFSIAALVKSKFKNTPKNILAFNASAAEGADKDEEDTIKLSKTSSSQLMFASPDEPASKFKRGSFLSRGSPSLSHLAEITKVNDGRNTNVKNNSRHFVFSTITPPEPESKQSKAPKRPANSQGTIQPKKLVKIDRSFSNLDDCSKDASIFKWI